jgi:hypothetical protein
MGNDWPQFCVRSRSTVLVTKVPARLIMNDGPHHKHEILQAREHSSELSANIDRDLLTFAPRYRSKIISFPFAFSCLDHFRLKPTTDASTWRLITLDCRLFKDAFCNAVGANATHYKPQLRSYSRKESQILLWLFVNFYDVSKDVLVHSTPLRPVVRLRIP